MSIHRRAAHRDAAEPAIIAALRAIGATVVALSGKNLPDLLVGYCGRTELMEVKSILTATDKRRAGKVYKRRTVTSVGQEDFHAAWRGSPIYVVTSVDEALAALKEKA